MTESPAMVSGFGQFHTNEEGKQSRRPYASITLDGIRALVDRPQKVDKAKAQWVIPSTLASRTHAVQEREGKFWMLWADLDKDPKPLDQVFQALGWEILNDCDREVYASRSARKDYQKGRILVPLTKPLTGGDWLLAQEILNDKLQSSGFTPDRASEAAGQLCYLPNRGDFYVSFHQRTGKHFDPLTEWASEIAAKRQALADQAAEAERRRKASQERREALRYNGDPSPVRAFNDAYSVEDILLQAGYDQRGNTFRHPNSESGSYSASVRDGRVHSLSGADPLYTGGHGGGAHDAFSAFCVLFHHGDQSAALRDAGDNWLTVNGESWNRARQREYMKAQDQAIQPPVSSIHSEEPAQSVSVATPAAPPATPHPMFELVSLAPISIDELGTARLTPRCVLPDFLYADVRTRISAGGTGKTTVALFEAVALALGRDLWGRQPAREVKTVIVTREDSREILVARMREIMAALHLTPGEVATVLSNVMVIDVSGVAFRLSAVFDDVVVPHTVNLEWIIDSLKEWGPDWIIFDPLVSFGVGESRVNDAEQGLIEAFRMLRNRLDCCIEGIHHSGKANAREKSLDQYSGRGGSALSDGSRMVVVMQPLTPEEWLQATGSTLDQEETGIVMALPKLSYSGRQESIFIRRRGYHFTMATVMLRSLEQEALAIENQVCQFIAYEYSQGRHYSTQDLENSKDKLNLSRQQIRSAVTALKVAGRIVYLGQRGKSGAHYQPVSVARGDGDTPDDSLSNVGREVESAAA